MNISKTILLMPLSLLFLNSCGEEEKIIEEIERDVFHIIEGQNFSANRLHLVDYNLANNTYFFRGNNPLSGSAENRSFQYNEIINTINDELESESLPTLANNVEFVDVSLLNFTEYFDLHIEQEFANGSTNRRFINWPLLGLDNIIPNHISSFFDSHLQHITNPSSEQLYGWVQTLYNDIHGGGNTNRVYYVHCNAGCDRTGEFVAAYRLVYGDNINGQILTYNAVQTLNTNECGREVNRYSRNASEHFCSYITDERIVVGLQCP